MTVPFEMLLGGFIVACAIADWVERRSRPTMPDLIESAPDPSADHHRAFSNDEAWRA